MTETITSGADAFVEALRQSHDRLAEAVQPLGPDDVTRPAYPSEWTIADTLSHLGSGAEIFGLLMSAGLHGHAGPGPDDFTAVWDRWNARTPADQARDCLSTDRAFVEQLEALSPAEREQFTVTMFNGEQDLAGFLQLRLHEHALHTWDIRVVLDPTETLPADATGLLLPNLHFIAGRSGQAGAEALAPVRVRTTEPDDTFLLTLGTEGVELTAGAGEAPAPATVTMPAEALIRLVCGRLDAVHTPTVRTDGVELDRLRSLFPGY